MERIERVRGHPAYGQLVRRRRRLAWTLTAIMAIAYFGYILLIAFDRALLATPIAGGATTFPQASSSSPACASPPSSRTGAGGRSSGCARSRAMKS